MKKRNSMWKKAGVLLLAAALFQTSIYTVQAAEPGEIVSVRTEGEKAVVYIQNPGTVTDVQCQIGTTACEVENYGMVEEQKEAIKTLLLLDNSLSVKKQYRDSIREIMDTVAANRMAGEKITIATFSDVIQYVAEDSDDYTELKQAIDGIEYMDQETYLTDVLYELLASWSKEESTEFRRIVLVSDGMDNKSNGYTKEELYSLLDKYSCPIYTLGCPSGDSDALKNMAALSRMTKADSWTLDEETDALAIASKIAEGDQLLKVTVTIPTAICDGTEKGIQVSMTADDQNLTSSGTVQLPFGTTSAEEVQEEPSEAASAEAGMPEEQKKPVPVIPIAAGVLGVAVLVAAGIVIRKKKKEDAFETLSDITDDSRKKVEQEEKDTEYVNPNHGEGDTAFVWNSGSKGKKLILSDLDNQGIRYEVPMTGLILVGRSSAQGCQVVIDYNGTVSKKHCEITLTKGELYVKDLQSKNGTFVDGQEVVGEAKLPEGSVLSLGKVRLKVELRA